MGHSCYDLAAHDRRAWNAGKKVGTKRPLKPDRYGRSASSSIGSGVCVTCALRSGDRQQVARLRSGQDQDRRAGRRSGNPDSRDGHPTQDGPSGPVRADERRAPAFSHGWNDAAGPSMICISKPDRPRSHMSTRQYARLVDEWVRRSASPQEYGTHSLRRTKASISTRRRETCEPSRSCLATPRSRTRSVISASMSRMPSNSPKQLRFDQERLHFPSGAVKQCASSWTFIGIADIAGDHPDIVVAP